MEKELKHLWWNLEGLEGVITPHFNCDRKFIP